jgi:hypothetical protein
LVSISKSLTPAMGARRRSLRRDAKAALKKECAQVR